MARLWLASTSLSPNTGQGFRGCGGFLAAHSTHGAWPRLTRVARPSPAGRRLRMRGGGATFDTPPRRRRLYLPSTSTKLKIRFPPRNHRTAAKFHPGSVSSRFLARRWRGDAKSLLAGCFFDHARRQRPEQNFAVTRTGTNLRPRMGFLVRPESQRAVPEPVTAPFRQIGAITLPLQPFSAFGRHKRGISDRKSAGWV